MKSVLALATGIELTAVLCSTLKDLNHFSTAHLAIHCMLILVFDVCDRSAASIRRNDEFVTVTVKKSKQLTAYLFFMLYHIVVAIESRLSSRSVVEENLSPGTELITTLVEVGSLVETTGPLNQSRVLRRSGIATLLGAKISVVKLLLPALYLLTTIEKKMVNKLSIKYVRC